MRDVSEQREGAEVSANWAYSQYSQNAILHRNFHKYSVKMLYSIID